MTDSIIIKPPRAFQFSAVFLFTDDARTDDELRATIAAGVSFASHLAGNIKQVGIPAVALPPQQVKT